MEPLLGEGTSFEDVEKLRKLLTVAEHKEFERQDQIIDLQDELGRKKIDAQWKIDQLIYEKKTDKEARKEAGYTNDKDWLKEIENNILAEDIAEIEKSYEHIEAKIESKRHHSKISALRIKNLKRKLKNRQIFAKAILNGLRTDEQLIPNTTVEPVRTKQRRNDIYGNENT